MLLPALAPAQGLTIRTSSAPINVLSINDVDFVHSASPQWLFSIDINAGGRSTSVILRIELQVALATGERFQPAVRVATVPLAVNGTRTITNLDLGKGKAVGTAVEYEDPQAKRKFEDIALPSGQLPAGTYTFSIRADEVPPGTGSATDAFSIVLTNPSSVELLFPADREPNVGIRPLFQWTFDGARSRIAVFELLAGQASLEEAVQGVPQVSQEVASTSFLYPAAGARPLEPGKTYVWFVEGHVRAPGGRDQVLRSPLRSFTVERGPAAVNSLLDELEQALGPKHKPLFDQIRQEGLLPFGSARAGGSVLSAAELQELLRYFHAHPEAVESAGLE